MRDMPLMGLGTFIGIEHQPITDPKIRYETTVQTILSALSIGYRHLDLAENYHNLPAINAALQIAFKPAADGGLGLRRDEIWLTMKANSPFNSAHIDKLLEQVGVEYFDLFLIHHPVSIFSDEATLVCGWSALSQLLPDKLHRIGVSNCYMPHLSRLLEVCQRDHLPLPFANEIELNVFSKKNELVLYCQENHINLIAYGPLGYNYAAWLDQVESIRTIGERIKATPAQVALAWNMAKNIAVIPKSTNLMRLQENWQAQQLIRVLQSDIQLIKEIDGHDDQPSLTATADEMEAHGRSLTWHVTPGIDEDTELRLGSGPK